MCIEGALSPSRTLLEGVYIPAAWVSKSVCLFVEVFLGPNSTDEQRPDAPLFHL